MKKKLVVASLLFFIFTTITFREDISISKFDVQKIQIKNNSLIDENELKKLLTPIYRKNLIFLKNSEIQEALKQNNLIEDFSVKKKYPDTLIIKIFEKKIIAILFKKKNFYLSDKFELIDFKDFKNYKNLPQVLGTEDKFKIFYNNLKQNNFPIDSIKKYILYESNRWDIETFNGKKIMLSSKNYIQNLENFLNLKKEVDLINYKIFDYRIENQLIMK